MFGLSKRHIAKTVSWRILGTFTTLVFTLFLTSNLDISLGLSGYTTITRVIWYYLHEIVWFNTSVNNANIRHLTKAFTWRGIGILDTVLISILLTGDGALGLQIGGVETIFKMILYYIHEKIWYRINFGLEIRKQKKLK